MDKKKLRLLIHELRAFKMNLSKQQYRRIRAMTFDYMCCKEYSKSSMFGKILFIIREIILKVTPVPGIAAGLGVIGAFSVPFSSPSFWFLLLIGAFFVALIAVIFGIRELKVASVKQGVNYFLLREVLLSQTARLQNHQAELRWHLFILNKLFSKPENNLLVEDELAQGKILNEFNSINKKYQVKKPIEFSSLEKPTHHVAKTILDKIKGALRVDGFLFMGLIAGSLAVWGAVASILNALQNEQGRQSALLYLLNNHVSGAVLFLGAIALFAFALAKWQGHINQKQEERARTARTLQTQLIQIESTLLKEVVPDLVFVKTLYSTLEKCEVPIFVSANKI